MTIKTDEIIFVNTNDTTDSNDTRTYLVAATEFIPAFSALIECVKKSPTHSVHRFIDVWVNANTNVMHACGTDRYVIGKTSLEIIGSDIEALEHIGLNFDDCKNFVDTAKKHCTKRLRDSFAVRLSVSASGAKLELVSVNIHKKPVGDPTLTMNVSHFDDPPRLHQLLFDIAELPTAETAEFVYATNILEMVARTFKAASMYEKGFTPVSTRSTTKGHLHMLSDNFELAAMWMSGADGSHAPKFKNNDTEKNND